ncbi:MAG: hypothetical protein SGJ20_18680, partial [Planctomycetota bacterium]|nr:hypothetical protein [Planctomycetota bacterium]
YINEPRAMPVEFFKNRPEMAGTPDREQPGYQAMCTSHPAVRQWLTDGMAYLFEKVPGLGGVITITASENLTNCYSRLSQEDCPHCRERAIGDILLEVNKAIAEGVHRSAPDAKVFVWDWAWFRHGDASETIAKLPKSVWLMSVSEWKLPIEHQGIKGLVGEYAMSLVGPGPRALQHWKVAKEHGLKIAAKTQYNCTWEIAALPFIPVMDLVAQHNVNLASEGLDGQMMSWSLGGYPSLNLELARRISEQKKPDGDAALQSLAEDAFGKQAAPLIRKAWTQFSAAFREYPYNSSGLYAGAQHMGPANLLYGKPTGYGATMVGFPYDDVVSWCGHYPDVIYLSQMQKLSEGWAKGMESFEKAVALADPDKKEEAQRELSVAKALGLHWASVANQTQFAMDRNAVARSNNPADQEHLKQRMRSTIDSEIALAKQMYDVSKADSRVGFEATMHYYYVPLDLVEKVINCEHVIAELK